MSNSRLTLELFNEVRNEMKEKEKRAPIFDMAQKLVELERRTEAYLLLLATWDFANLRYSMSKFTIPEFESHVSHLEDYSKEFSDLTFESCGFKDKEKEIKEIFENMQSYKVLDTKNRERPVIGTTGASKLMHLRYPNFFIMWDSYIRGNYPQKYSKDVDKRLIDIGWEYKRYTPSGKGYYEFMSDMWDFFKPVFNEFKDKTTTLPKAIDEFNYVAITLPLRKIISMN